MKAHDQGILDPSNGVQDALAIGLQGNSAVKLKLMAQFQHALPNGTIQDVTNPVGVSEAQHHSIVSSAANHPFADPSTRQDRRIQWLPLQRITMQRWGDAFHRDRKNLRRYEWTQKCPE